MKNKAVDIQQDQRIFPISPSDSNYFLNTNVNGTMQNGQKKKLKSNYMLTQTPDTLPLHNDSEQNILYLQKSPQKPQEKIIQEELTKRAVEQYKKAESQLEDLVGQNQQSNDEDSCISNDKHVSSFVRKFQNITWYKLIYLVSEALQRWKGTLNFIRIQNATQSQLDAINDKCFFQSDWNKQLRIEQNTRKNKSVEDYSQSKFIRRLKKKTRFIRRYYREISLKLYECKQSIYSKVVRILKHIPIFDPLDNVVLIWEILYFMLCMFLFVYLPFSVSFEKERTLIIRGFGYYFLIVFLGIDILKNMNTAVYVKGELIKEHLLIFKEYMNSLELPLDVLTYFSAIGVLQFNYSRAIYLLRIFYKPNLLQKFKDAFQMSEKSIATVDLLKLFATVLYLCHVVACVWHKIGEIQYHDYNQGWIVKFAYQDESIFTLYVNSYFYSIIMMSSVKGNIQPNTNVEKIFSTLIAFGACVLFGYTITSITIILRNLNTKWDNFNLLISQISKFMRQYNVDVNQQSRARKYVEYVKEASLEEKRKQQNVLNCLSKQLQNDIFINIYSQALKKLPFFTDNFSDKCIDALALKMQSSFYASDDVILDVQQIGDPALYFIIEGEVIEYYYPNCSVQNGSEIIIKNKKKGEIVGLQQFVTNSQKPTCNAKSLGVTELHYLKYKDFIEIIQKFPIEKEHYFHMKDQLIIHRKTKYIEQDCQLCYSNDHFDMNCTETFLEQRKRNINFKYGRVPTQKVDVKRKNKVLCYHSLTGKNKIEEDIVKYINDRFYPDKIQQQQYNKIKTNESRNQRQIKKEQKILSLINQYNQDKMHEEQNEFQLNFLSPSSNINYDNNSNIILIDPQDQTHQLDVEDLNLLSPSKLESDSPYTMTLNLKKDYARLQQQTKESQYVNKKDNIIQTDGDEQPNENSDSSIKTFTPKNNNKRNSAANEVSGQITKLGSNRIATQNSINKSNENKLESERYPPPQIQNFTTQPIPQMQNTKTFSINLGNGDETTKSVRAQAILNRKQRSLNRSYNSYEDMNVNNVQQLQIGQLPQQFKPLINIPDQRHSIKTTLNQITERSVVGQNQTKEFVSVDYSIMANFKIYFPHNNFASIFKVNKPNRNNSRRSVINPILLSNKNLKSQDIK